VPAAPGTALQPLAQFGWNAHDGEMRFSVFTASTPDWTPQEAAVHLAEQGWDGIEWRITDQSDAAEPGFWAGNRATWPLTGLEANLAEIVRVTSDAGLQMSALGSYVSCADHDNVERILAATAAMKADRVRVMMPKLGPRPYRELFDAARRDLQWTVERAEHHGVRALVELHHGTITSSASAALRLVDGLDPRHVGVIHDIGNLVIEGWEDPAAGLDMLGEYLAHVHVKNVAWHAVGTREDGSTEWKEDWASLREGQVDIAGYVQALHRHGYDGWITVEDFSTVLPLAERTRDNLAYLMSIDAA
jgi:sugar phosphate isomerase/epimerase